MIGKRSLIYNHGVNDYPQTICINGKCLTSYNRWRSMLQRCFSEKYHKKEPAYKNCKVCDEWLFFTNFKKWFDMYYVENWHLDKDLLSKGCKLYSPETCCFVPREINNFLENKQINKGELPIGTCRHKSTKRIRAHFSINNKTVHIGYYDTPEEAHEAYAKKREEYAKLLAEQFKDKLDIRAYNALINYKEE